MLFCRTTIIRPSKHLKVSGNDFIASRSICSRFGRISSIRGTALTSQSSFSSTAHSKYPLLSPCTKNSSPTRSASAFDELRGSISAILKSNSSSVVPKLNSILKAYSSEYKDWSVYAHTNPKKQYTRNLVCEVPGVFNLLLLMWTPGKASSVHDHADSHCLMKILKGSLRERRYAIPRNPGQDGPLVQTSELFYQSNKVAYMSDELGLHEISNPSCTEYSASLHLYFPPNAALRGCRVYDIACGAVHHTKPVTYDSVQGTVHD